MVFRKSPHRAARHVEKFHKANPRGSKDLAPNTLNFKPILDLFFEKIVRGTTVPGGGALVRLGHSLPRAKIWEHSTP